MFKIIDRVLDKYAQGWGLIFASKWMVLICSVLPLVAVGQAVRALFTGDPATFVAWLSSNALQLIALPVLAYLAARNEASHQVLHEKVDEAHSKLDELHQKIDGAA